MEERSTAGSGADLGWLLDDLADRVEHLRQAVILSRDGLAVAASKSLERDDAEHLSALAAGVQSLAKGAGAHFGAGGVQQIIIELERAYLFVTSAGQGGCLAVLCSSKADPASIAYEMALLVQKAGAHLAAEPRFSAAPRTRVE